jgi:putative endonuclease
MRHYVYILKCADNSLYTGYTTDLRRRVAEHNGYGPGMGARATRGKRPVELVFNKYFMSRSKAMSYEAHLKQLSRAEKLKFLSTNDSASGKKPSYN